MRAAALLAFAAVGLAPTVRAKSVAEQATEPCQFACADGSVFRYRWHEPAAPAPGRHYPLVILMHGSGECGDDNVAQLKWGANEIVEWFRRRGEEYYLLAGQAARGEAWAVIRTVSASQPLSSSPTPVMARQVELIESLLAGPRPIDRSRVYVTGVSLGGYGTWDLLSRKPFWFAAAMPVCGGGDLAQIPKLKDVPIFIHHGADDRNVSVWNGRSMYAALILSGSNCARYSEYPGRGHDSWVPAYAAGNLDWLFAQRHPPFPDWKAVTPEKAEKGVLKVAVPGPRYEIEFSVRAEPSDRPSRVVGRRGAGFPIVTVAGRVAERTVFGLQLGDRWARVSDPPDGRSFEYSQFRVRALAKEER